MKSISVKIDNQIIGVLILIMLTGVWAWLSFGNQTSIKTSEYIENEINKICFNDNFCLEKAENDWWLTASDSAKKNTDKEKVLKLVDELKKTAMINLVSINQENFQELGLGGEDYLILEVNNKKIEIGKLGNDYQSTLVKADDNRVYSLPWIWNKTSMADEIYWRDEEAD